MTFVLSVHSRDSLWVVADRRVSYGGRRPPIDDAVKVMQLETTDGVGLLAYAGLGATSRGTQPSEWMSAVLRGRRGLTFEQALHVLAAAVNEQLPKHLASMPYGGHFIIIPAFVRGVGPRLYSIDNVVNRKTGQHWYRFASHQQTALPGSPCPRLATAGTGGINLARKDKGWQRALFNLVDAHDRGKVSGYLIADQLARLNEEAHREVRDGTVGPRCIVVWCRRPGARRAAAGNGHIFYTGVERDPVSDGIPTIMDGMDAQSIAGAFMKLILGQSSNHVLSAAPLDINSAELTRLLAELPTEPDEKLR
jgi:hypothetical protein